MGGQGSGRRPRLKEYSIEELVHKSIHTVSCALDDDSTLSQKDKADLASRIVQKRIPAKLEVAVTRQLTYEQRMALADKLERIVSKSHPSSVNTPQHVDTSSIKKANDTGTSTHTGTHTHISTSTTDPSPIDSGSTETNSGVRGGVEDEGTVNTFPKDILELDDTKDSLGSG